MKNIQGILHFNNEFQIGSTTIFSIKNMHGCMYVYYILI